MSADETRPFDINKDMPDIDDVIGELNVGRRSRRGGSQGAPDVEYLDLIASMAEKGHSELRQTTIRFALETVDKLLKARIYRLGVSLSHATPDFKTLIKAIYNQ